MLADVFIAIVFHGRYKIKSQFDDIIYKFITCTCGCLRAPMLNFLKRGVLGCHSLVIGSMKKVLKKSAESCVLPLNTVLYKRDIVYQMIISALCNGGITKSRRLIISMSIYYITVSFLSKTVD